MIRFYNKNHAAADGSLIPALLVPEKITPESLLVFWTHHPVKPTLVDLQVFGTGNLDSDTRCKHKFSGRPTLIRQIAPFFKLISRYYSKSTLNTVMYSMRSWFSLMDDVEKEAAFLGVDFAKIEDVCDLSFIHYQEACKKNIKGDRFRFFLIIVNTIRQDRGLPKLYWAVGEKKPVARYLPHARPVLLLRGILKENWEQTRKRWMKLDVMRTDGFEPSTVFESKLCREWEFLKAAQIRCSQVFPSGDQLREGSNPKDFTARTGFRLYEMWVNQFENGTDINSAFHMCLAVTAWNPAVLLSLDASCSEEWLHDHPSDQTCFVLIGTKARAGGNAQPIVGLWKTKFGAGSIIRLVLERTTYLRRQLIHDLAEENAKLDNVISLQAPHLDILKQYEKVVQLQEGTKSVWLYVARKGGISWINESKGAKVGHVTYLTTVLHETNQRLRHAGQEVIGNFTPSDFRDAFAEYVWRHSGGNVVAVMRALTHSRVSTTQKYLDNNLLNAERDGQFVSFVGNLFLLIKEGNVQPSLLAHMQKIGNVSAQQKDQLDLHRKILQSRIGVGCSNPLNPPERLQSKKGGFCSAHRCLVCPENAVILRESLDGISMRVEELIEIKFQIPIEAWMSSDFQIELQNGIYALGNFDRKQVNQSRNLWRSKIASGSHHVPGLTINQRRDISEINR
ncbi:site-specific integrase [Pseudomonas sp. 35 E 8]|uniref:site-specific integrase n=1 Tax=Pseudomonas sp. 35 E 8 TaxID=1844103 RepID=UPI001111D93B|nr:site-specific integrase [Pseudomonas sp. 35 E 8]